MKKIISLILILALAVCAAGFAAAEPSKEMKRLSDEALSEYSAEFEAIKDGGINPLCCFLLSDYEKIEDMDFSLFLHNFPGGEDVKDEKEFEALKKLEGWPFGDVTLEEMPVPVHKYSRAAVDKILEKHGNISSDELTEGKDNVLYLEEYDAFYNYTSDFALESFTCVSGESVGGTITLRSEKGILKIAESEDGDIVILSYMTDKAAAEA